MKKNLVFFIIISVVSIFPQFNPYYQRSLLDQKHLDEIIGEISGETALNHIYELGSYIRNRPTEEYGGLLWESEYVLGKLKEYGLDGAEVEKFPGDKNWDGISGSVWEISPKRKKIADYRDMAAMLASGSKSCDIEADLIWVEEGTPDDFNNKDVSGKIILTSGSLSLAGKTAFAKGALGIISFESRNALTDPIQIPIRGLNSPKDKNVFGFYITSRDGYLLRDRLLNKENIRVKVSVKSQEIESDLQVPTCVIKGTDPDAEEIIFSAHLFEGLVKQGANDNISGSAAILEIARTLKTLYDEGRLPKPKRSIRFIWVPEFSGSIPWVQKHRDIMNKTLCNINLDMVGLWLKKSNSFFCLMRTSYGNPHYLNDVAENFYRYVGETNIETIFNWGSDKFVNRITAPSGSDDPFYYSIQPHTGSSDHEVFNNWGVRVPGIMMITWPDLYYHTSQDLANKCDATQLKRVGVIGAAIAHTIVSADAAASLNIINEIYGNSLKRIGYETSRAMDLLKNSAAENFTSNYKKAIAFVNSVCTIEKSTISSVQELAPGNKLITNYITKVNEELSFLNEKNINLLKSFMITLAEHKKYSKANTELTEIEKQAIKIIPKETNKIKESGYFSSWSLMRNLPEEIVKKYPAKNIADRQEMCLLINGKRNLLEIKSMLDMQSDEDSDLVSMIEYLEILKYLGLVDI